MSFKSGSNQDIMFTREIINRTARETGETPKAVEYLYNYMLMYLYKQVEYTDCCAFRFPKLGIIYIKEDYINKKIQELEARISSDPDNIENRKRKIAMEHKKEAIKKYLSQTGRPISECNHYVPEKIFKRFYSHGKPINEMVEVQNRLYREKQDEFDE